MAAAERLGTQPLTVVTVHYAGAFTAYGPLVAGTDGIQYFTTRSVCETGLVPVSQAREHMVRGPKRHAEAGPVAVAPAGELLAPPAAGIEQSLIAFADDNLGVSVVAQRPGAPVHLERHEASGGLFVVVLAGVLRCEQLEMSPWESIFVSGDEISPPLTAGTAGVQMVSLHLPRKPPAYP